VGVTAGTFSFIPGYGQSKPAMKTRVPGTAAAAHANIAIPDIPYTKFVLANGLTVIVHEDHKAPIIALNTWYHVGSKNEQPGKTGFAHLFEHLVFSGSENFDFNFGSEMNHIGATDNKGGTNSDRTCYH
jgi:zinc protease